MDSDSDYISPGDSEDVLKNELRYLWKSRDDSVSGLAISGGGIRSAAFGLGVMQALRWGSILERMDYLSTVSGGGFIGSALTWWLSHDGYGVTDDKTFPFGATRAGARVNPEGNANSILDFIRQQGNYLSPGKGLNVLSMGAIFLRALFVSLLIKFLLLTLAMTVVMFLMNEVPQPALNWFNSTSPAFLKELVCPAHYTFVTVFFWLLAFFALSFALGSLSYLMASSLGVLLPEGAEYRQRTAFQVASGRILQLTVILAAIGLLPVAYNYLSDWKVTALSIPAQWLAILQFLRLRKKGQVVDLDSRVVIVVALLAAVLVLWGLLFGSFVVAPILTPWLIFLFVFYLLYVGMVTDVNAIGIHGMYRDRLMEIFLPDPFSVSTGMWGHATQSNAALMEHMCQPPNQRPYHLINTNIVLVDSPSAMFRGRGGDSFILSPLYCGSYATGWRRSGDYMKFTGKGKLRRLDRARGMKGMTLATAMAISGAAANPNTGVAGRGITRNRIVSTLMHLLNVRLGYWAPHPNPEIASPWIKPNFLFPGLRGGVFPSGHHENRDYVELTDGGHFENLGIYELIRRKVNLIIASDASADPDVVFGDLGNVAEKVGVDFGATIRFEDDFGLQWLLPQSACDEVLNKKYNLAKRGFAIGTIDYHDGTQGRLVYIKTTVTRDLPVNVYSYKSANPTFPDETTADQFFDEAQFEAYRELGFHLGKQFLAANATHKWVT